LLNSIESLCAHGAEARLCHDSDVLVHCFAEITQIIRTTYK